MAEACMFVEDVRVWQQCWSVFDSLSLLSWPGNKLSPSLTSRLQSFCLILQWSEFPERRLFSSGSFVLVCNAGALVPYLVTARLHVNDYILLLYIITCKISSGCADTCWWQKRGERFSVGDSCSVSCTSNTETESPAAGCEVLAGLSSPTHCLQ